MAVSERCLMTWEPAKSRWRKMHRGTLFTIACSTLGCPPTKEGSYRQANAWWGRRKAELESPPRFPNHDVVNDLIKDRDRALEEGALPEALELHARIVRAANPDVSPEEAASIAVADHPDMALHRLALAKEAGIVIPEDADPRLLEYLFGETRIAQDRRHRRPRAYTAIGDRAVAAQVDKYLALEKGQVRGDVISVGEYEIVSRALHDFRDWIGEKSSIESIDADKIEEYWSHLVEIKLAVETKKKKLRHMKNFVGWLSEKGKIPRPLNLESRKHRFGAGLKAIKTVETSEVKRLIEAAPGQLKLHVLLMINCGFTQIDISDLKPSEVDWKAGRIKRKRSKTDHEEDVPIVDYPLWPETFALLQEYGHREGDHALLTESGRCWVRDYLKPDGRRSKVDNIKSNFAHLKKRGKLNYSLKRLRKTSSTLLGKDHPDSLVTLFLGQSPRTIATRHYQAPDQGRFDSAVMGLRAAYLGKGL